MASGISATSLSLYHRAFNRLHIIGLFALVLMQRSCRMQGLSVLATLNTFVAQLAGRAWMGRCLGFHIEDSFESAMRASGSCALRRPGCCCHIEIGWIVGGARDVLGRL